MSILRTLRDRADSRPMILIYATPSCDDVAFGAELERLQAQMDGLRVVHVPETPPDGWSGRSGYVDREMLESCLSADERDLEFFICGPEPMMDLVEGALRELGVRRSHIYTERFQIV
jgi:ferredoxin-NADP reductase